MNWLRQLRLLDGLRENVFDTDINVHCNNSHNKIECDTSSFGWLFWLLCQFVFADSLAPFNNLVVSNTISRLPIFSQTVPLIVCLLFFSVCSRCENMILESQSINVYHGRQMVNTPPKKCKRTRATRATFAESIRLHLAQNEMENFSTGNSSWPILDVHTQIHRLR